MSIKHRASPAEKALRGLLRAFAELGVKYDRPASHPDGSITLAWDEIQGDGYTNRGVEIHPDGRAEGMFPAGLFELFAPK